MSRASAGSFADVSSNAPSMSMLQQKRKKAAQEVRRTGSQPADPSVSSPSPSPAVVQSSMQNENLDAIITEDKTTTPPGDDEIHRCESGDLLNGVGSASSLASTVSSVFSNNQTTMSSYPGQTSSLH